MALSRIKPNLTRPAASPVAASPKVLVLLSAHNGAAWVGEQITTILSQRQIEVRLIIGDDASTDDTWQRLEAHAQADRRVHLERWKTPSGSAGAGFRRLIARVDASGCSHVALADQDDLWLPGKLRNAVDALEREGADGYSAAVEAFWPDGRTQVLSQSPHPRAGDFLFEGAGQGCTFVLTARLFAEAQAACREHPGVVGALHYHDWMIYLLARSQSYRWVFDPVPQMRYRQHAGNEIGARSGCAALAHRIGLIRDGWYSRQLRAAALVYCTVGGNDAHALAMAHRLDKQLPRNWPSRLALAVAVLQNGRRRLVDRVVVALAAIAGWI